MLYEEKVRRIDSDDEKISEFDKDIFFFKIFITFGASPIMCQCIVCGDGLLSTV